MNFTSNVTIIIIINISPIIIIINYP